MNFDYSSWITAHKGHNIQLGFDGSAGGTIHCLTCGLCANVEGISGKINASDTFVLEADKRVLTGKLSPNVPFLGVKK